MPENPQFDQYLIIENGSVNFNPETLGESVVRRLEAIFAVGITSALNLPLGNLTLLKEERVNRFINESNRTIVSKSRDTLDAESLLTHYRKRRRQVWQQSRNAA